MVAGAHPWEAAAVAAAPPLAAAAVAAAPPLAAAAVTAPPLAAAARELSSVDHRGCWTPTIGLLEVVACHVRA